MAKISSSMFDKKQFLNIFQPVGFDNIKMFSHLQTINDEVK